MMVFVPPVHNQAAKHESDEKKQPSAEEQAEGCRAVLMIFSFLALFAGIALLAIA
jgi:hypothetical protein